MACSCNDPAKIAAREQRRLEQAKRREEAREARKAKLVVLAKK